MPCYVYILASESFAMYIGVTRDLRRRVFDHRHPIGMTTFVARHRIFKLVYFEATENIVAAIAREKQLKGWRRTRKIALIERLNPEWRDLADDWFGAPSASAPSLRSG